MAGLEVFIIPAAIILSWLAACVKVLNEYERGVVFRLGRLLAEPRGPGLRFILYPIDRMVRISLRTVAQEVPPQDVITRDNVSMKVSAVIYFRVIDANRSVVEVEDYLYATSQMAQTSLRSVLGQVELDDLLSQREQLNQQVQTAIDRHTDPWGVKVSAVEIKQVDLPEEMRRAIARQAEAERTRRAKVIGAEGEFQAAEKLVEASKMMSQSPISLQLRYLQTLAEIATNEKSTTTIFPVPIDLLTPFLKKNP